MNVVGLRDVLVVAPAASSFHHHHHHHVDVCDQLVDEHSRNLHFYQQQQQQHNPSAAFPRMPTLDPGGGSGTATCQDCGNQAKKDCTHRRCRTCCKGRGFDCTTHVRSTWVPAARRRERQQQLSTALAGSTSASTSGTKKPRLVVGSASNTTTSTSNNTPPVSFDTTSCHQDASFKESLPRNVRAPAVFKCVRVTSIDDGEDVYAYQAMVKIGGHVFKGFLYDQGVEDESNNASSSNNNSSTSAMPNISVMHLGSGRSGGVAQVVGGQSDAYVGAGGGTQFGNHNLM